MTDPLTPEDIRDRFHVDLVDGTGSWKVSEMIDEIIRLQDMVNQLEADTKALVSVTANAKNEVSHIRAAFRDLREKAGHIVELAVKNNVTDDDWEQFEQDIRKSPAMEEYSA